MIEAGERIGSWIVEAALEGSSHAFLCCYERKSSRAVVKIGKRFDERADFLPSAETLDGIRHPALVRLKDWGFEQHDELGEIWYVAMEEVAGETLASRLASGPLASEQAVALFRELADGLALAHAGELHHGNLLPDGVVIRPDGSGCLVDFGFMKHQIDPRLVTLTSDALVYRSPESVFEGDGHAAQGDVYALGLMLYEALTGEKAFVFPPTTSERERMAWLLDAKMTSSELDPGDPHPDWLREVVRSATQPIPARRPTVRELHTALRRAGGGETPRPALPKRAAPARPSKRQRVPSRPRSIGTLLLIGALGILIVFALGLAFLEGEGLTTPFLMLVFAGLGLLAALIALARRVWAAQRIEDTQSPVLECAECAMRLTGLRCRGSRPSRLQVSFTESRLGFERQLIPGGVAPPVPLSGCGQLLVWRKGKLVCPAGCGVVTPACHKHGPLSKASVGVYRSAIDHDAGEAHPLLLTCVRCGWTVDGVHCAADHAEVIRYARNHAIERIWGSYAWSCPQECGREHGGGLVDERSFRCGCEPYGTAMKPLDYVEVHGLIVNR